MYNGIVSRKNLHQHQYRQQYHQLRQHQKLSVNEGSGGATVSSSSSGLYKSGRHLGSSKSLPTTSSSSNAVGGTPAAATTTSIAGLANTASPSSSAAASAASATTTSSQTTPTLQNQSTAQQQQQQQQEQQQSLANKKHSADQEGSGQNGNLSQFSPANKLDNNLDVAENGNDTENGDSLQKSRIDCKSEELSRLKTKCELLIRMCIGGLLLQMTDQSFKDMEGKFKQKTQNIEEK